MSNSSSNSNFGELVLLLGDLNLPHRINNNKSAEIPDKFQRMLLPNNTQIQHVLCTGNLGINPKRVYEEFLRPLCSNINVHVVSGDFDPVFTSYNSSKDKDDDLISNCNFPESKVLQIGLFRIGLIHGHQVVPWGDHASLAMIRRKLDVDVLVYGSGSSVVDWKKDGHGYEVCEYEGFYHIHPGSMTGTTGSSLPPSFILLSVQGNKVVAYCYELKKSKDGGEDQVDVSKSEFTKSDLQSRRI